MTTLLIFAVFMFAAAVAVIVWVAVGTASDLASENELKGPPCEKCGRRRCVCKRDFGG